MGGVGAHGVVGRERELAMISDALSQPHGPGIALLGPPGVGKTCLAGAAGDIGEAEGMVLRRLFVTPSSRQLALGALGSMLPPTAELDALGDELGSERLGQAMTLAWRDDSAGREVLVVVDDAHLLDPTSAGVLIHLALSGAIRLVFTARTGEPLNDSLLGWLKDGAVRQIEVGPLIPSATAALAAGLLDAPLDAEGAHWLHATSAGNALYARELVLGARDVGGLVRRGNRWELAADHPPLSPLLTELVEQRLVSIGAEAKRALELVALAEPIGLDLIEGLVGEAPLVELDERGLLSLIVSGSRVELRPSHPLYSEALRQQPLTLRRRRDLVELIRIVERSGLQRRDDPQRVALWRLTAGEAVDPAVLLRAAQAAQQAFDDPSAARLAEIGLAQPRGLTADLDSELRICAGTSLARLGAFARATELLTPRSGLHVEDRHRARLALRLAFIRFEGADNLSGARTVLLDAIEAVGERRWRDELRLQLVTTLADAGHADEAAALLAGFSVDPGDAGLVIAGHIATAATQQVLAEWTRVREVSASGYEFHLAHPATDTTFHPASLRWYELIALQRGGWSALADERLGEFTRDAVAARRPIATCIGAALHARVLLDLGRLDEAWERASFALSHWNEQMQPYIGRWARAVLAMVCFARGEVDAGRELVDLLDDAAHDGGERAIAVGTWAAEECVARCLADLSARQRSTARSRLSATIAAALDVGNRAVVADLLAAECVLLPSRTVGERLGTVAAHLDRSAPISAALAALASAAVEATDGAWVVAAEAFERIGHRWSAGWLWKSAAAAARRAGNERIAAAHQHRGRECHVEAMSPGDPSGWRTPVGLTERETEIAVLVAQGLSSKDVARRLVISVRTVDNHLQRVYSKLGVTSRTQLAALLVSR